MIENLIYDVGMNNGDDTAYYLQRGFRVIAVEANPILVSQAIRRFQREVAEDRLIVLNVGIAEQPESLPFWICETYSEWSSFDQNIASRDGCPHHAITIACRRFESVLEEYGIPYYLKVDIEGNDLLCLQDLNAGDLPKYISVEATDIRLLIVLRDLGYTSFKCISQFNFLPLEIPPSREQRYRELVQRLLRSEHIGLRVLRRLGLTRWLNRQVNRTRRFGSWVFPWGSSGTFGEDLRGRWQSFEEMWSTYRSFQQLQEKGVPSLFWNEKEYSFWSDFHARRDS
jgi:FkbM family methyltransferase